MAERLILALMVICTVGVAWVTGDCGKAPTLENGSPTDDFISSTSFPVNTKVLYKCNPGYIFKAGSSRSVLCMEDSTWAPLRAICELKNCGNPGEILNGYYEAASTTFGSRVTFFCSDGYQIVGRNYRICTVDGWSGQVPTCETVKCADPPSIANGKVTPSQTSDWEYGMIAKYICSESYTLIGAAELHCTKTGMWNTDPPICKVVQCKRPELPANIQIVSGFGPMYKYREEITFRCRNNYEMVGKSVIECSADSTFVPQPPTCILRTTTPPTVISTRAGTTTTTITATTKAAATRFGAGEVVGWRVTAVTCNDPPPIQNGRVSTPPTGANWEYGMIAKYSCLGDSSLIGAAELICTATGRWNKNPPVCRVARCYRPEVPENSQIVAGFGPTYRYRDIIIYRCNNGFEIIGKSVIQCGENNVFVPPPPSCVNSKY